MKRARATIATVAIAAAGAVALVVAPSEPRREPAGNLCWMRPTGVAPGLCFLELPDGGVVDPGEENVIRGVAVGRGCIATRCSVMQGERGAAPR